MWTYWTVIVLPFCCVPNYYRIIVTICCSYCQWGSTMIWLWHNCYVTFVCVKVQYIFFGRARPCIPIWSIWKADCWTLEADMLMWTLYVTVRLPINRRALYCMRCSHVSVLLSVLVCVSLYMFLSFKVWLVCMMLSALETLLIGI